MAFVLQHAREHPFFLEQAATFHAHAMEEVLTEMRSDLEAYRKLANLKDIVELFGPRLIVEEMGADRLIAEMDEEKIIHKIGEEKVVEDLLATLGAERLKELVDRKVREGVGNGKSGQS